MNNIRDNKEIILRDSQHFQQILVDIGVEERVIIEALSIFMDLPDVIHKWSEKKVPRRLYLCVTEAYRKLLAVPDTHPSLEETFSFNSDMIKNLQKDAFRAGYNPVVVLYEPEHFVPRYMKIIGIDQSHRDRIERLIRKYVIDSLNKPEMLPQDIAAAAVVYYARNNGYKIDEESYTRHCQSKKVPSIVEIIGIVDNVPVGRL